jgi:hypothetical protein
MDIGAFRIHVPCELHFYLSVWNRVVLSKIAHITVHDSVLKAKIFCIIIIINIIILNYRYCKTIL